MSGMGRAIIGLLAVMVAVAMADYHPPTVHVYMRKPVTFGQPNVAICYTDGFHPPRIAVKLMENGAVLTDCKETDLAFNRDWTYHKTVYCDFTPKEGALYECEVTHDDKPAKKYQLEMLM